MEQDRKPRNESTFYGQLIYDKEGRTYNGGKISSLVSDVGKTK